LLGKKQISGHRRQLIDSTVVPTQTNHYFGIYDYSDAIRDEENTIELTDDEVINLNDFLLVKFPLKTSIKH
jgi:hypothetical protein